MINQRPEIPVDLAVPRETFVKLRALEELVRRWNPAVNLISRSTAPLIWERHILDSLQLCSWISAETSQWVDLGSGGGFPGLVVAVIASQLWPQLEVTLVDSDHRKAAFLREAGRVLDVRCRVVVGRIEEIPPLHADILSARALADLATLLAFGERHLRADGLALFLKGARYEDELNRARMTWSFKVDVVPSLTDVGAAVLAVKSIKSTRHE